MQHQFWHDRWNGNQLGFHEGRPNALLMRHLERLELQKGARIFLPLCGKARDIGWLMAQGLAVCGAELSEIAIRDLFADLQLTPDVTQDGALQRFSAPGIEIFVGDIFDLGADRLGPVDAVYDRAALVALPDDMRADYSRHLPALTGHAPQLLITFDYDQSVMNGPPFAVDAGNVKALYDGAFDVALIDDVDVAGGLKGKADARELVWHLTPRR